MRQGFTLIELLVVIAIIGLLATIALSSFNSIKTKSRDTRRMADMNSFQLGLSLYYNDNDLYPDAPAAVEIDGSTDALSVALISHGAMRGIPVDPINGLVGGVTYKYYYQSLVSRADYVLTFYLETDSIPDRSQGVNTISP